MYCVTQAEMEHQVHYDSKLSRGHKTEDKSSKSIDNLCILINPQIVKYYHERDLEQVYINNTREVSG